MSSTFIIIDDDEINNFICTEFIRLSIPGAHIRTFTDPLKGLDYIQTICADVSALQSTVLLLDINMPVQNGWSVLEKIDALPPAARKQFRIYMLSSSIDPRDTAHAAGLPTISGSFVKPLTDSFFEVIARDAGSSS